MGLFGKKKKEEEIQVTAPAIEETAATIDNPVPSPETQSLSVDASALIDDSTTKEDNITEIVSEAVAKEDVALGVAEAPAEQGVVDSEAAVFTTEVPAETPQAEVAPVIDIQNVEEPAEAPAPVAAPAPTEEAAPTITPFADESETPQVEVKVEEPAPIHETAFIPEEAPAEGENK